MFNEVRGVFVASEQKFGILAFQQGCEEDNQEGGNSNSCVWYAYTSCLLTSKDEIDPHFSRHKTQTTHCRKYPNPGDFFFQDENVTPTRFFLPVETITDEINFDGIFVFLPQWKLLGTEFTETDENIA